MEGLKIPAFVAENANLAQCWDDFKEAFLFYLAAADLDDAGDVRKISILMNAMGKQYQKVYKNSLGLSDANKKKYKEVIKTLDAYFQPKKLVKGYITRFQKRIQSPQETISDYITALRELANNCNFGDNLDTQLCVQISNGVSDMSLKKKLWSEDLTLDDIIKKCHLFEQQKESMELYGTSGSNADRSINYTRSRGRARGGAHQFRGSSFRGSSRGSSYRGPFQRTDNTRQQNQWRHPLPNRDNQYDKTYVKDYRKCKNCGGSHGYRQCPAYGLKCKKCFEYNHFASMCYSGNKPSHVGLYYNDEKDYGEENIDRNCFHDEYKNYYYDENDCYNDQIDLSEQLQKVKV